MNYPQICRLLAATIGVLALGFIISMGVGFFYGDPVQESQAYMGWMTALFIAVGLLAIFHALAKKPSPALVRREALCAVGLGWLVAIFITAIPFRTIVPDCSWANAIFEGTSGLTTTGSTVFGDVESLPKSLLFWRSLSQWIGGIGVIVVFVAVLSSLGVSAKVLYSSESSAKPVDMDSARIQETAVQVIRLYLGLSAISIYVLWLAGMPVFDAICHGFSAIATAGFSTRNGGIAAFNNPAIEWALIVIMILGATNFFYMLYAVRGRWYEVRNNEEFRTYILILGGVSLLITWILFETSSWPFSEALRHATFQVTSFITTTGFSSKNFALWVGGAQTFLVLLMFVGGCSG
ncbi:MAG TPA: potassium transporter TrkG, partial [Opitutales bacterium]|nr:potassium transporter TrkG [Opitutales bacterium]